MKSLPNIALEDVPVGKNEKFNKEIKKIGDIPNIDLKTISHLRKIHSFGPVSMFK